MAILYRIFLITAHYLTYADGGVCFTKKNGSLCYTDTQYFMASNARSCCNHYDAMGYVDTDQPSYDYNLQTNLHYTSCTSCGNFLESESVICFTRANHNACRNVQQERKASPKACCESNLDGGYAKELSYFINPEGYVAHYTCTPCTRMHASRGWAEWSSFSSCSVSCGDGVKQRHRSCLTPPQIGLCEGGDTDVEKCSVKPCDHSVSSATSQSTLANEWSEWTFCNVSCGIGVKTRQKLCIKASRRTNCVGNIIEYQTCHAKLCSSKTKSKIGVILFALMGGVAVTTIFLIMCICFYWKLKKENNKRLPQLLNNKRAQSMQAVFVVSKGFRRGPDSGIDNVALEYSEVPKF